MRQGAGWSAVAVLAAVLLAGGALSAVAQDKEAQIKARQDFMKAQGADVKAIAEYANGKGDKAAAEKAAEDLLARSPKVVDHFPAGTSAKEFPGKTAAKPEIWMEWDKFKTIPAGPLHDEEAKLANTIKTGDAAAVKAQIGALGKNGCNACHDTYRLKQS